MSNSIEEHFDKISQYYDNYKLKNKYYYDNLKLLIRNLLISPENKTILECGCGTGEILAYLMPKKGIGIDISKNMINLAKEKLGNNQNLEFIKNDLEKELFNLNRNLDYVLMIDILEHLQNPSLALKNIKKISKKDTELIITTANKRCSFLLYILEKLRLKMPEGKIRWFSLGEINNLLEQNGWRIIKSGYRLLIPANIPLSNTINNNFHKNKFIKNFGLTQFIVAKIAI